MDPALLEQIIQPNSTVPVPTLFPLNDLVTPSMLKTFYNYEGKKSVSRFNKFLPISYSFQDPPHIQDAGK